MLTGSCAVQLTLHSSCTAGAADTKAEVVEEGKFVAREGAEGVGHMMPRADEASSLQCNIVIVL